MRHVSSTGSPCPPEVKRAMIDWWGPVFNESYGSSELGYMTYVTSAEALAKPGTAGRAIAGCELAILDEQGHALPTGQPGMIYARQPTMVDFTYQGNDSARRAMERDGFMTMGDVGYLDRDGYLFIVDRSADMVISGGVNIYPAEIEQALLGLHGVEDCAVFGIPDDEFGEALAAAVQPRAGVHLSADEVRGVPARAPRRLQGAARRDLPRRAAARGHRQDLQAQAARAVLGRARTAGVASAAIRLAAAIRSSHGGHASSVCWALY